MLPPREQGLTASSAFFGEGGFISQGVLVGELTNGRPILESFLRGRSCLTNASPLFCKIFAGQSLRQGIWLLPALLQWDFQATRVP